MIIKKINLSINKIKKTLAINNYQNLNKNLRNFKRLCIRNFLRKQIIISKIKIINLECILRSVKIYTHNFVMLFLKLSNYDLNQYLLTANG